ncbi:hypothetical protein [Legionella sp. km772]|uniref:hypothetical protein n=1 Tax=Legionella sp. km772 TaxID=2498111 RepID=UPI000F8F752B|nr:hypothetical protein [Legionella sp. km772]RUR07823.1 hypothetical protein ELY15_11755 [Legionella sp. km772]
MIKLLLENLNVSLNNALDYITFPKFKKNCDLIDSIKSSIEADLNRLKLKDPTFLDGPDGHIDYYSPHAEQQLANQRQIIERSIQQLRLLQATLYVFYKYSKEGKSLQGPHVLPNSVEGLRLLQLKKETIDLLSVKSLDEMEARPDIQEALTKIKEYNEAKQQLKDIELELKKGTKGLEKTKLETKQAELALKIKDFEQDERPGFLTITHELSDLNRKLLKHEKIKSQLPKGMQDIKRALSLVNEIKAAQLKLAKKQKELTSLSAENPNYFTLKTEIENLEEVIKTLNQRISFSANEKDDKDLKDMLEDMRKLMTTSINGYQKLLTSGGDMNAYLHQTTGFYWENLFLYRKTLEAFNQKLKDTPNLTAKGEELAQCVTKALEDVPSLAAINKAVNAVKQVDNKLSLRGTKYNEKVDEYRVKFYKEGAVSITNTILEQEDKPFFFLPYNANNYVLDHPAHVDIIGALGNCYGETQMFLKRINCKSPSVNNICPETELMNFQLDQTRSLSANPETQGTFTASNPGDFAKWDTIKDFITKPATSTAHGDVCYLRFSGARVPGHDADVAHAMGLIKFTNPDPYKYIVYDYNLGAMGFSTETQLQTFFKQIFEAESGAYYPYSKCVMQKVDEVTPECANFINGVNGIQSLKKANPNASCIRNYWQPHRLELFTHVTHGQF